MEFLTFREISDLVFDRMCARAAGRPIDHSSDSFDRRVAVARAARVFVRIKHGQRMSMADAFNF